MFSRCYNSYSIYFIPEYLVLLVFVLKFLPYNGIFLLIIWSISNYNVRTLGIAVFLPVNVYPLVPALVSSYERYEYYIYVSPLLYNLYRSLIVSQALNKLSKLDFDSICDLITV
jgi:hypothetical protein